MNLLLFSRLDRITANRIVAEMYALPVQAGEILIQQGDSGDAATKLFVVRSGKFEVRVAGSRHITQSGGGGAKLETQVNCLCASKL